MRIEQQSQRTQYAGGESSSSTIGLAFKGEVCPRCTSDAYVSKHTIWHAIVAVLLFPIGLLLLLFPVKRCLACRSDYGAGNEIAKVIAIGVISLGVLIGLAILGIAADAAN